MKIAEREMKLLKIKAVVTRHLNEIAVLFRRDCELTFIMRDPKDPDAWLLISNDNINELIGLLKKARRTDGP